MEAEKFKRAKILFEDLEDLEDKLKSLNKSEDIDSISIARHQSGASMYSYDVKIHHNKDLMRMVKAMVKAQLACDIDKIKKEIESL